jgi:hypothetical protein
MERQTAWDILASHFVGTRRAYRAMRLRLSDGPPVEVVWHISCFFHDADSSVGIGTNIGALL